MNDDSLILGEGVQRQVQEELSPFRLTTITSSNNECESSKFSLISSKSSLKESSVSSESNNEDHQIHQFQPGNYNSLNSNFNTLKSKIKAAFVAPAQLDKYRKSSMTKQLKNKFKNKEERQSENLKLRSHSHGALPSLDEFSQVKHSTSSEIEDDINGIWSASQLQASKQAKENAANSSIIAKKKEQNNGNNSKVINFQILL